ncbi:hypothetical protein SAMN05421737_104242 [Shouchella lonarensis]|uniref:Uncharacterized protein n=2 Tax=Shouchella lonarensis TaxID=1464122 RepID=A0A1G6HZB1_9BACI|nr:hypothetical protein SAMN05421737_104242 [Shouchella lonarensis]
MTREQKKDQLFGVVPDTVESILSYLHNGYIAYYETKREVGYVCFGKSGGKQLL